MCHSHDYNTNIWLVKTFYRSMFMNQWKVCNDFNCSASYDNVSLVMVTIHTDVSNFITHIVTGSKFYQYITENNNTHIYRLWCWDDHKHMNNFHFDDISSITKKLFISVYFWPISLSLNWQIKLSQDCPNNN